MGEGSLQGTEIGPAEFFLMHPHEPRTVYGDMSLQMVVNNLRPGLELMAERNTHGNAFGSLSLPIDMGHEGPNILFPKQDGLMDLTLRDLASPERLSRSFRYVPLLVHNKLQYLKRINLDHIINNNYAVIDWETGLPYSRLIAMQRFWKKTESAFHSVYTFLSNHPGRNSFPEQPFVSTPHAEGSSLNEDSFMPAATAAALGLRYDDDSSGDDSKLKCKPSLRVRYKDRDAPLVIDFDDRSSAP